MFGSTGRDAIFGSVAADRLFGDRGDDLLMGGPGGDILMGGGNDRIENSGTLSGDIELGAGDDVVELTAGSTVLGAVNGQAGADILRIIASADTTHAGNDAFFFGFETAEKTGAGTLTFTGTMFVSDGFTVRQGALSLASGSAFEVGGPGLVLQSGTTLSGLGSVRGVVDVASGGVVAAGIPGSGTIGVLSADDARFRAGSILDVDVNAAQSDRLVVAGITTVDTGAQVRVRSLVDRTAFPTGPQQFTVLTSGGGVTGNFQVVPLAFFSISSANTGNAIVLTMTRNAADLGSIALADNQRAVAGALQPVCDTASAGDQLAVCDTFLFATAGEARTGLDEASGAGLSHAAPLVADALEIAGRSLDRRVRTGGEVPQGLSAFADLVATAGEIATERGRAGRDDTHFGVVGGLEHRWPSGWSVGGHGAFIASEADAGLPARATLEQETVLVGAHAAYAAGAGSHRFRLE